ncbi:MAG: V-type ATP synthase subunit F [Saccharofermentanales bacterium]|jgi:V/A-type H+-transporting ATPase subunit F
MYKVAVIGDSDSIIGFRALGLTVLEAVTPEAAEEHLRHAVDEDFAIVFITEPCFIANQDYIRSLRSRKLPAVIPIPPISGGTGLGMSQVRESVRKAIGMDILGIDATQASGQPENSASSESKE